MKKLKRWNRGLITAAILIIAVIIFQAVDQARFKSSIPEISNIIRDYETRAAAALPESHSDSAPFLNTLEQYWSEPETVSQSMRYSDTKSSFYSALEDENIFLPLACQESLRSCRIKKSGPGTCSASLVIDSTTWLNRYGSCLTPFGVSYAYNETAEDYAEELETPESVKNGQQAIRLSSLLNVTLQLTRTDGSWKITCSQMYASSSSTAFVDIQEVPV